MCKISRIGATFQRKFDDYNNEDLTTVAVFSEFVIQYLKSEAIIYIVARMGI